MIKTSIGNRIFNFANVTFFILMSILMLIPFINILTLSLEPNHIAIETGVIHLIPKEVTFKAYAAIWKNGQIVASFKNSVFITVLGALGGVIITAMLGYGLSYDIKGRRVISFMVLFTMMFHGGIIPSYILIKNLGMMNSLWSLIIPSIISAYNVILMRAFFKSLPPSLAESAMIDGATEMTIFFRIILPLSMPIIATITLFYAVGKWNEFFHAIMYITDAKKKPLQVILREILIESTDAEKGKDLDIGMNVKMATVFVAIVPILCVYPFLQKYFSKGILLGAVKG